MKNFEQFCFQYVKKIDVAKIKELCLNLSQKDWLENSSRQKTFELHSFTETFFLADYSLDWLLNTPYEGVLLRPSSELWQEIIPIVKFLEKLQNGRVGRVILPKLKSKGYILPHVDGGDYLVNSRRYHIPIITNEQVFFSVGNECLNMKEGEIWEINNTMIHGVENLSNQDRIHLMIDIIPNKFLQ